MLETAGIACEIRNDRLAGALGEIPFVECWPELWVVDNIYVLKAQELLTAAAGFARDTGLAISVVLRREPGVVAQAQAAAQDAEVAVTAAIKANTVCIRFSVGHDSTF